MDFDFEDAADIVLDGSVGVRSFFFLLIVVFLVFWYLESQEEKEAAEKAKAVQVRDK